MYAMDRNECLLNGVNWQLMVYSYRNTGHTKNQTMHWIYFVCFVSFFIDVCRQFNMFIAYALRITMNCVITFVVVVVAVINTTYSLKVIQRASWSVNTYIYSDFKWNH